MSFEGYYQAVCKNGHPSTAPCNYSDSEPQVCLHCGAPVVWTNLVDDTNCDNHGYVELEETGKTFTYTRIISIPVVKIPKAREKT